jgi:uncharacterized repeat protein (TIGR01451 family)
VNTVVTDGTSCTDGNVCNGGETCVGGVCNPGQALNCNDGNACTVDACHPTFGCNATPVVNGTSCADANVCNGAETCQNAICQSGPPLNCDDTNPCTSDSCDPVLGCQNVALLNGSPCADGTVCNGLETCQNALCTPGTPLVCDDGNVCTTDSCDPVLGCVFTFNTVPCNDGLFCTVGETCQSGTCGGGVPLDCSVAADQCNVGVCNESADACQPQPANEGETCFTDVCMVGQTCSAGSCTGGSPLPQADCFSARFIVANSGSGTASIVRASDARVEATLTTGLLPANIAVTPDANAAYITNNIDDSVTVVSLVDYSPMATIPVGVGPIGIAATPDGQFVYVANNADDSVSVIATAGNGVITTIPFDPTDTQPAFGPTGIAVTRNGAFVYVTNNRRNTVSVIRTSTNTLVGEIVVRTRPYGITPSPNGLFMYLTHAGDDSVGVIRLLDNALVGTVRVGAEPVAIAFQPDGKFAYAANSISNTVTKINTQGSVPFVAATIPVGQLPSGIAVTSRGDRVAVANSGAGTVTLINAATNSVAATVPVGVAPAGVAARPQTVLSLAGSASPTPAAPGSDLTFTFTYGNASVKISENVALSATIPAEATFVSATGGGVVSGGAVTWTIGQLLPGASGQRAMTVRLNSPLPPNTLVSSTAAIVDDEGVTSQATVSATVDSDPLYSLAKVEDSDPVQAGGTLTYTITYTNNATANANGEGVVVTETYDPNFTFVSSVPPPAPGTNNQWAVGSLPVGASGTIRVTGTVRTPLANGTILQNRVSLRDSFNNQLQATQSTVVQSSPLLGVAIADDRDPVAAGTQLSYTINYTNSGTENASGVVVMAAYDPSVVFVSASPPPDAGTTNSWTVGSLNVGASGVIVVTVRVAGVLPNGTILTNQASISSSSGAFAVSAENTTVSSQPALTIGIQDAPDPIGTGELLTYTVTYANSGSDAANGTRLVLGYDPGVSFVSAVPPPTTGTNEWALGALPVGGSGSVVVTVQVNAPLGSILTTQASISDVTAASAAATQNTTVQITPVLTLSVNDSADPVQAGSLLSYAIRYGNTGNTAATNLVVSATYDPNVTFLASSPPPDAGTTNVWTLGSLNNGVTGQVSVTVRVNTPLPNGTMISTQGVVTAAGGLVANASQSTTVQSAPALSITKTDSADPTPPGQNLTYTINYANSGTDTTTGVVITEAYDPLVTFLSAVPAPDAGTNNRWTIGTLAGGQSGTIVVTVAVPNAPNGTPLTNRVSIADAAARSATATESTTVNSPNFGFDVSDNADPVTSGQVVQYTVDYSNLSPSLQTGVVLRAIFHADFVVESSTPAPDAGTSNVWTIGTLVPGGTGQLVVRGFFGSSASGGSVQTQFEISNANGTAFTAEATVVNPAPKFSRHALMLRQGRFKDVWTLSGRLQLPADFDATAQPLELTVFGPGGVEHVFPLVVGALEGYRDRWRFQVEELPPHGKIGVRLVPANPWRLVVRVRGAGAIPPFPADRSFQIRVRVGPHSFLSPSGTFRESMGGTQRRYP